jgi:hypothetical protein
MKNVSDEVKNKTELLTYVHVLKDHMELQARMALKQNYNQI